MVGTLYYGASGDQIHIEDRALAHLKFVTIAKLRREESFALSWKHPEGEKDGRSTIWLHPAIPLRFEFDEPERSELNRAWLDAIMQSSHSTGGISLVDEIFETEE